MNWIDHFIHPDCRTGSEQLYRSRVLAATLLAFSGIILAYFGFILLAPPIQGPMLDLSIALLVPTGAFYVSLLFWLRRRGAYHLIAHTTVLLTSLAILVGIYYTGGPSLSPATHVIIIPVVAAFFLVGRHAGMLWAKVVASGILGLTLLEWTGWAMPNVTPTAARNLTVMMNWSITFFAITATVGVYEAMNRRLQEERDKEREMLAYLASHDQLTGVANRSRFEELWQQVIYRTDRSGKKAALLYLDLDGFKQINDNLGHEAGDVVLKEVARRLGDQIRKTDIVARLGGDEFVVGLEGINERDNAEHVLGKLQACISEPVKFQNRYLQIAASIGLAVYPDDGQGADQIVQHADQRMYEQKREAKTKQAAA